MNILSYFTYNTSSPSNLVWNNPNAIGKGSGERIHNTPAGSKSPIGWNVQVTENGNRIRSTVNKIVWELHNGAVPSGHQVMTLNNDRYDTRIENLALVPSCSVNHLKAWLNDAHGTQQLPSGHFFTCIREEGRYVKIGTFDSFEEAKVAYRKELWERVKQFFPSQSYP